MRFLKLWVVRALLSYGLLWVLFLIPYSGVLLMFAMAMAGPYLWGLLPHFIIFALLADIISKRLSRAFLIVPILIYGAYYGFYIFEEIKIKTAEIELSRANPPSVIKYDPNKHILVTQDQGSLGKYYKIPVTYEGNANFTEGAFAYRLASTQLCDKAWKLKIENVRTTYFSWMEFKSVSGRDYYFKPNACQITSAEALPSGKSVLKVVRTDEDSHVKNGIDKQFYKTTYDFYFNDSKMGTFIAARTAHLPLFPFFFAGCGLNSARASWDCFADFSRKNKALNTYPEVIKVDPRRSNPIAIMLGLKEYEEADLKDFSDNLETIKYVDDLYQKKHSEKPEDFNEWGVKKDSPTIPNISLKNGAPSFEGTIYTGKEGGPFYAFIKNNAGKIVYISAHIGPNVNANSNTIGIYDVCLQTEKCNSTDHLYLITSVGDARYNYINAYGYNHPDDKIEGYWRVGEEIRVGQDGDTNTNLIGISSETLDNGNGR